MKLAAAAAQQLKGVVVEYDVLCSTLLGKSMSEHVAQRQHKLASIAKQQQMREALGTALDGNTSVGSMFISDVRALLKDLNQDSTGKPWVVKDRLEKTLQGLPSHIMDRVTGSNKDENAGKSEDEIHLESQLASASAELERRKQQKEAALREQQAISAAASSSGSSIREKYLDKINKLKAKLKGDAPTTTTTTSIAAPSVSDVTSTVAAVATSKGLTTWIVNDGTNEVLSYSDMRGLFKAVLPPRDALQREEFEFFLKEMDGQFDAFMTIEDYERLPDPEPIAAICKQLGLEPPSVMVLARHATTIRAARSANTNVCHYIPGPKDIPNHSAHHHLKSLKDFQYLVEEFNGISYRGRIKNGTIVF